MTPLAIAVCCREWPVDPSSRIGRCGFCGERPVIDWTIVAPSVKEPIYWTDDHDGNATRCPGCYRDVHKGFCR